MPRKKISLSISIDSSLNEQIEKLCEIRGVDKSRLMEKALMEYLIRGGDTCNLIDLINIFLKDLDDAELETLRIMSDRTFTREILERGREMDEEVQSGRALTMQEVLDYIGKE